MLLYKCIFLIAGLAIAPRSYRHSFRQLVSFPFILNRTAIMLAIWNYLLISKLYSVISAETGIYYSLTFRLVLSACVSMIEYYVGLFLAVADCHEEYLSSKDNIHSYYHLVSRRREWFNRTHVRKMRWQLYKKELYTIEEYKKYYKAHRHNGDRQNRRFLKKRYKDAIRICRRNQLSFYRKELKLIDFFDLNLSPKDCLTKEELELCGKK